MRGLGGLLVAAAALGLGPFGCSGDDSAPGAGTTSSGGVPDGGAGASDAIPIVDAEPGTLEDGGGVAIVDVADTPCSPRGGTETVLYNAASGMPAFSSLFRVGGRRAAGTLAEGFVLFDLDGANPSASLIVPVEGTFALASTGANLVSAWWDQGAVVQKGYDGSGQAVAGLSGTVASEPATAVAAGGGGDVGLVVWANNVSVRARGVAAGGAPGGAFDLANGIAVLDWTGAVAHAGGTDFGVAFATTAAAGDHRLYFVPATTTAQKSLPRRLLTRAARVTVTALARTKSGFALLALADGKPHLFLLDDAGRIVPPIRRILGATRGVGLAVSGDEVGLLAVRAVADPEEDGGVADGPYELRPFGATGDPLAPWVCLGGTPLGFAEAAIDSDGAGYAIVHRTSTADIALLRVDNRGGP